jgi:alcohol dehydrogenase (NADP+)
MAVKKQEVPHHLRSFFNGDTNSFQFKPKVFGDNDVDIKIECCGVCGSDVHTINGGWGGAPLPICVGHEIVGKAIKVGSGVKTVKEGDRVGVGAQIWACLKCPQCKSDNENYCPHQVGMSYGLL